MAKIIIQFDDDHDHAETVEEVTRLVNEGYTSGYYPTWEIIEDEE